MESVCVLGEEEGELGLAHVPWLSALYSLPFFSSFTSKKKKQREKEAAPITVFLYYSYIYSSPLLNL